MKTQWIGVTGLVLILAALLLGTLGIHMLPNAFWYSRYSASSVPGMMGGNGMMSGGMMSGGVMGGGVMGGGVMGGGVMGSNGMMSGGMMNASPSDVDLPFDQSFLSQMIVHHQGAVMSAQMMIANSARPELRDLAARIISAQQREIDQMAQWRQDWYGATNSGMMSGMMGGEMMDGMMDRDHMRQMMGANADFDRMFLDMMIPHHEAAIAMAEQALERAEHSEIKTLAQTIITTQQTEIEEMRGYLREWYGGQSS